MNKTVNVNIGGVPFIVDEDAYTMLSAYFTQIENRLSPLERREVMEDVENRIADIFTERLGIRLQVINTTMVSSAISIIGNADAFGEIQQPRQQPRDEPKAAPIGRTDFYRSRDDRRIAGICGAVAKSLNMNSNTLRLILVLVTIFSFSFTFWVYIVTWIIIPEEPLTIKSDNNEC